VQRPGPVHRRNCPLPNALNFLQVSVPLRAENARLSMNVLMSMKSRTLRENRQDVIVQLAGPVHRRQDFPNALQLLHLSVLLRAEHARLSSQMRILVH